MPRLSARRIAEQLEGDTGWVRIGMESVPVSPVKLERARSLMREAYLTNSVIHLLTDTFADFILSEGIVLKCDDEAAAEWLDIFWRQNVEPYLDESIRELLCTGELLWVVDNSSGSPCIVPFDTVEIRSFQVSTSNRRQILAISVVDSEGREQEFDVWPSDTDRVAVFLAINKVGGSLRGAPAFLHILDQATVFDKANVSMLARLPALYAVWWDVTLRGFTPEQVRLWEQQYGGMMPQPGTIIPHNDAVTWDIKSAAGTARTSADWYAYYRDYLMVTGGVSPSVLEGVTYRVSEAASPTHRALRRLKRQVYMFFQNVAEAALHYGGYRHASVRAEMVEAAPADFGRMALAVARFLDAIATAQDRGWLSPEDAAAIASRQIRRASL